MTTRTLHLCVSAVITSLHKHAIPASVLACTVALPAAAQGQDSNQIPPLLESAELARFLTQMDELCEMTDEIVFAQSVLLLGHNYGWEIWSNEFAGSGPAFYLFNVLEETELPAVHIMRDVQRNSSIVDEDRARAESLFTDHKAMRAIGKLVHTLVSDHKANDAAAIYLDQTIPMRRAMRANCYTVADRASNRIAQLARDTRLAR
ncbi:MAG: hypothetical protein AAGD43_17170 [Pseudomonadota bacterium]